MTSPCSLVPSPATPVQALPGATLLSVVWHHAATQPETTPPRVSTPQVSMLAVDEMYDDLAMLEKDLYWDAAEARAPYTAATAFLLQQPSFQGSTFDIA